MRGPRLNLPSWDDLSSQSRSLLTIARQMLWDPRPKHQDDPGRRIFGIGFEAGQYGNLTLGQLLAFAKDIGAQMVQPSNGHIDLIKAGKDADYRSEVLGEFERAGIPLVTVSTHCPIWGAGSLGYFEMPSFLANITDAEKALNEYKWMLDGLAALGVPFTQNFFGFPCRNNPYVQWPPGPPTYISDILKRLADFMGSVIEHAAQVVVWMGHEIHWGTAAMNADDFIALWEHLGRPKVLAIGFDPSHFWHGESWRAALQKLRQAGVVILIVHAKDFRRVDGQPMLGWSNSDGEGGFHFCPLGSGEVNFMELAEVLTMNGYVELWNDRLGLPAPLYVEAESPHFAISSVTAAGVKYLQELVGGMLRPQGHYTDQMKG